MYRCYPTDMKAGHYLADLALALKLADHADAITSGSFRAKQNVSIKSDSTPVTDVDVTVEQALRDMLAQERPSDTILGEEYGGETQSARQWVIDPIDGTKNYIHNNPFYATLIALQEDGHTIVAVVSAPMLGNRWWATYRGGAWRNGKRIRVSNVEDIQSAYLTFSSLGNWHKASLFDAFIKLYDSCGRQRAFGDFYNLMLLAEGAVDIAVEPSGLSIWDIAAPQLIIEEAGGICDGLHPGRNFDGSVLATNGSVLQKKACSLLLNNL